MINEIKSVIEKHKDHIPVVAVAELLAVIDGAEKSNGSMKQTFDWMREQMQKEIVCTHVTPIKAEHARIIAYENAIKLVNEAEAKWESDCCEWKHGRNYVNCFCRCYGIMVEHDMAIGFKFCPYCGKRIKISEVE